MGSSFLPDTDSGLLAWSSNFIAIANASPGPTGYGLTSTLMTAYQTANDNFAAGMAACDPNIRSKSAVAGKNTARSVLKAEARLLAKLVEGTASVTNEQKIALGLNVKAPPSPHPVPDLAPALTVASVSAWTVKIKLKDAASAGKRGKPPGVSGASVFTFVGETAPTDIAAWQFEGSTGRTNVDVPFPNTLAAGTKVFISAFWFNGKKQSGPLCVPVGATLQGGSVTLSSGGLAIAA